MSEDSISLEVRVVAATYYDFRDIGGVEGVTLYCRHPNSGELRFGYAPAENWHSLTGKSPALSRPVGGVHANFEEPYPTLGLTEDFWDDFRTI